MKHCRIICGSLLILFTSCATKKKINTTNNEIVTQQNNQSVVEFAKSYIGIPYKYGGNHPNTGFDCSGFVQFVFLHFGYKVPRVSKDYANTGKEIEFKNAKVEDIILFAGADQNLNSINHIGIITDVLPTDIKFIHSSSTKGIMISNLNSYFKPRMIKIIRLIK
jgi:murein DD-endopeptidase / murein LD-carboxypeptidase